ncbi:MAG: biotin--[acetyl-CoA-carboxylase] ligase [Campylobacterales bacterium]
MEIYWFDELESTQLYLIEALKQKRLKAPVAVVARRQYGGIGSRGSRWIGHEGNLHLSLALPVDVLPSDLPLASVAIYAAMGVKEILARYHANCWVKWPNDIYQDDKKVGGIIINLFDNTIVAGIGLNLAYAPENFDRVDIPVSIELLVDSLVTWWGERHSWKEIFSSFSVEFEKSRRFSVHCDGGIHLLKDASLNEDGSLTISGKRVTSGR